LELRADDGWKKVTDSVNVSVVKPELTPPLNPGQNSSGGQNQIPPKKPVMKDNRSFYAMAILGILPIILSVIVLIATTEVGKYGSILALAPLYSKIRKDALLDNFKRGQIYRLIVEHPGVHFSRILSELDINNGAATFHLKKLEDDQYIISKTDGFKKRFYPGDKAVPSLPSKFEQIAAEVRLHAGITQKELSKEFDIPTSTINVYIKKMEASGVITTVRKGKKVLCYLNEDTNEK
jgi:predicted transcriptional regulator